MAKSLKVGERIAVYQRYTGTVVSGTQTVGASEHDRVFIRLDGSERRMDAHPKQCRRLRKRKRREWRGEWRKTNDGTIGFFPHCMIDEIEPLCTERMTLIEAPARKRGRR